MVVMFVDDCCDGGQGYFLYCSYCRNLTGCEFSDHARTIIVVKLLSYPGGKNQTPTLNFYSQLTQRQWWQNSSCFLRLPFHYKLMMPRYINASSSSACLCSLIPRLGREWWRQQHWCRRSISSQFPHPHDILTILNLRTIFPTCHSSHHRQWHPPRGRFVMHSHLNFGADSIAGHFVGHTDTYKQYGQHRLIQHARGYSGSHWTLPSGDYPLRINRPIGHQGDNQQNDNAKCTNFAGHFYGDHNTAVPYCASPDGGGSGWLSWKPLNTTIRQALTPLIAHIWASFF